jgi:uncharacterized protein YndB with AHSA1/START domain
MKQLEFKTTIHAPAAKVWQLLWNDTTYRHWTSVFHDTSFAKTDWKEGSSVHFLGDTGDGMYSKILSKKENIEMIFEHLGVVKNFAEQPMDADTKKWSGSKEQYFLKETNGVTELVAKVDIVDDFEDYFSSTFPKALEKIKDLAEGKIKEQIIIATEVNAPLEKVWNSFTGPEHITKWNQASPDWHCPAAENDLRTGGSFKSTMAAKDGSFSFDFGGTYLHVDPMKSFHYITEDKREVLVEFIQNENSVRVRESFHPEGTNPHDMQRGGWKAILESFKKYTESN